MEESKYNYFIDFIKFIFSFIIVIYHSWIFKGTFGLGYFNYGYLAVDFYFITTGYLMMNSISSNKKYKDLGTDTFQYLKRKFIKLLPYLLLSYIIAGLFIYESEFLNFKILFSNSVVAEVFQLSSTGVGMQLNTATWYISSMLIALLILYPLARKYKNTYIYVISPIVLLFLLTLIYSLKININDPLLVAFFGQNGLYKAFIFIILGNYSYILANKIKVSIVDRFDKILLTIIEFIIYILLIITFHYNIFGTIFVALITLIAVSITFSKESYTSKIFNKKIFSKLSKFGFIIFLNNTYVRGIIQSRYPNWTFERKFIYYIVIVLIISLFSYILIDVILKKINNKLTTK